MILGESGSGKTRSLKNLDPNETMLIQPIKKPLPFRSATWKTWDKKEKTGSVVVSDQYSVIKAVINGCAQYGKKYVIIDDAQYIMLNEALRRSDETGFKKFTDIAKGYVDLVTFITNHQSDLIVYLMTHTDSDENGKVKAKTVGKMIDSQVCLEGLFSIVMRCIAHDGNHYFTTKTNGADCVKTPEEMFTQEKIENDLAHTSAEIIKYYGA